MNGPSLSIPAEDRARGVVLERLVDYSGAPQREDSGEEGSMIVVSLMTQTNAMQTGSVRASVV
jgi:hypothetical protein